MQLVVEDVDWARANTRALEMEAEAADLPCAARRPTAEMPFEWSGNFRYVSPGYEVTVPLPLSPSRGPAVFRSRNFRRARVDDNPRTRARGSEDDDLDPLVTISSP